MRRPESIVLLVPMKEQNAHKPRILIIEDNKHNHALYRDAFEKVGFDVELLENADGYFSDAVSVSNPDLISMDLMLGKEGGIPERDGFEAIEVLKHDLRTAEIPVFVLTSFFEEKKVLRAKELGAVDFISLTGEPISKIAAHYMKYWNDPKHYIPSHPLFRS